MESLKKAFVLKKELDALRPIKKDDELRIMQKIRLDWNYHSNNLEGNSLTYGETKALILFGITAQGKPFRDSLEVNGHNEAIEWVLDVIKQERPITESFIRELHELILQKPYEVDAITPDGKPTKKRIEIGQYKKTANHVKTKTGEIFRFATPEETPSKMGDLMSWFNAKVEGKDFNPVLVASEFHYRFIRIHPFDDGNGRTARILMNFILMQHAFPPVIIKTEDKENYFSVLRQADAGLLEPFVAYIAQNLVRSLEIMISGAKGESIEDPDDLDKELALLEQKLMGGVVNPLGIKQSILDVYCNSILPLYEVFIDQFEKFKRFYVECKSSIQDESSTPIRFNDYELNLNENTKCLKVEYLFQNFVYRDVQIQNYLANIEFEFFSDNYKVSNGSMFNKTVIFTKDYGVKLSTQEINKLVNLEVCRHKDLIEKKLEEHKKQNNN